MKTMVTEVWVGGITRNVHSATCCWKSIYPDAGYKLGPADFQHLLQHINKTKQNKGARGAAAMGEKVKFLLRLEGH